MKTGAICAGLVTIAEAVGTLRISNPTPDELTDHLTYLKGAIAHLREDLAQQIVED